MNSGVFFAQSYIDGDNTIISYQGIYGTDQVGDPITLPGGGLTAALVAAAQFYQYVEANPASSQSSQQVSIAGDAVLTDWADAFANPLPGSTATWWNDATDPTGVGADGAPNGAPDVYDLVQTNADGSTTVVETLSYQTYQQTIEVGSTSETVTRGQRVEGAAGSPGDGDGAIRLGRRPNTAMARRRRRPLLKFEQLSIAN